jgi:hypothetical protein
MAYILGEEDNFTFVNQQQSLFIVESEDGHMHVVNGRAERKKQP